MTKLIFFVGLATHLKRNLLESKPLNAQQPAATSIPSTNITATNVPMTSATTATRRATGLTSAPSVDEQPNQTSQQQPGPSSKTVKYNFSSFIPNNKNFEIEQDISTVEFKVDNLKHNLSFWKNTLHANNFVLNVIEFGYLIPFFETPPSVFLRNNASSLSNTQFVETAIADLLSTGVITEYKDQIPSVVNRSMRKVNTG